MKQILLIKMWGRAWPAFTALITIAVVFLWPALPLKGFGNWIVVYANTPYLCYLYPFIAVLSGIYVGLYVYNKKVTPCCSIETVKGGAVGSFMGILLGACPACIPVVAIFLPLAFNIFLSRVAPIFSIISILILFWVIYKMNGFKQFA